MDYTATNQELLQEYAKYRRTSALTAIDAKQLRRDIDLREVQIARNITGKNAEERKNNLILATAADADYGAMQRRLSTIERQQAQDEAECEIISKYLAARQWDIRLRIVEALEILGIARAAGLSTPIIDEALDGMSHGNLESEWYAQKRRPQPTYAADSDDLPF